MQASLSFPLSDLKGEKSTRFMSTATWGKKITSGKCFQVHTSLKQCMDTVTVSSNQYNTVSPIELNAQASVPALKFSPGREKIATGELQWRNFGTIGGGTGSLPRGFEGEEEKGRSRLDCETSPPSFFRVCPSQKWKGARGGGKKWERGGGR